jgi:hypothetical protein
LKSQNIVLEIRLFDTHEIIFNTCLYKYLHGQIM